MFCSLFQTFQPAGIYVTFCLPPAPSHWLDQLGWQGALATKPHMHTLPLSCTLSLTEPTYNKTLTLCLLPVLSHCLSQLTTRHWHFASFLWYLTDWANLQQDTDTLPPSCDLSLTEPTYNKTLTLCLLPVISHWLSQLTIRHWHFASFLWSLTVWANLQQDTDTLPPSCDLSLTEPTYNKTLTLCLLPVISHWLSQLTIRHWHFASFLWSLTVWANLQQDTDTLPPSCDLSLTEPTYNKTLTLCLLPVLSHCLSQLTTRHWHFASFLCSLTVWANLQQDTDTLPPSCDLSLTEPTYNKTLTLCSLTVWANLQQDTDTLPPSCALSLSEPTYNKTLTLCLLPVLSHWLSQLTTRHWHFASFLWSLTDWANLQQDTDTLPPSCDLSLTEPTYNKTLTRCLLPVISHWLSQLTTRHWHVASFLPPSCDLSLTEPTYNKTLTLCLLPVISHWLSQLTTRHWHFASFLWSLTDWANLQQDTDTLPPSCALSLTEPTYNKTLTRCLLPVISHWLSQLTTRHWHFASFLWSLTDWANLQQDTDTLPPSCDLSLTEPTYNKTLTLCLLPVISHWLSQLTTRHWHFASFLWSLTDWANLQQDTDTLPPSCDLSLTEPTYNKTLTLCLLPVISHWLSQLTTRHWHFASFLWSLTDWANLQQDTDTLPPSCDLSLTEPTYNKTLTLCLLPVISHWLSQLTTRHWHFASFLWSLTDWANLQQDTDTLPPSCDLSLTEPTYNKTLTLCLLPVLSHCLSQLTTRHWHFASFLCSLTVWANLQQDTDTLPPSCDLSLTEPTYNKTLTLCLLPVLSHVWANLQQDTDTLPPSCALSLSEPTYNKTLTLCLLPVLSHWLSQLTTRHWHFASFLWSLTAEPTYNKTLTLCLLPVISHWLSQLTTRHWHFASFLWHVASPVISHWLSQLTTRHWHFASFLCSLTDWANLQQDTDTLPPSCDLSLTEPTYNKTLTLCLLPVISHWLSQLTTRHWHFASFLWSLTDWANLQQDTDTCLLPVISHWLSQLTTRHWHFASFLWSLTDWANLQQDTDTLPPSCDLSLTEPTYNKTLTLCLLPVISHWLSQLTTRHWHFASFLCSLTVWANLQQDTDTLPPSCDLSLSEPTYNKTLTLCLLPVISHWLSQLTTRHWHFASFLCSLTVWANLQQDTDTLPPSCALSLSEPTYNKTLTLCLLPVLSHWLSQLTTRHWHFASFLWSLTDWANLQQDTDTLPPSCDLSLTEPTYNKTLTRCLLPVISHWLSQLTTRHWHVASFCLLPVLSLTEPTYNKTLTLCLLPVISHWLSQLTTRHWHFASFLWSLTDWANLQQDTDTLPPSCALSLTEPTYNKTLTLCLLPVLSLVDWANTKNYSLIKYLHFLEYQLQIKCI